MLVVIRVNLEYPATNIMLRYLCGMIIFNHTDNEMVGEEGRITRIIYLGKA